MELEKSKLERDPEGKPKIILSPLEKTVVNTQTQEDYNTLIQVYECGGWDWGWQGDLPTQNDYWSRYEGKTCIRAEGGFKCANKRSYQREKYQIISTQEFYDKQKISQENINEINKWFEQNRSFHSPQNLNNLFP